jgi:hypothetical protein
MNLAILRDIKMEPGNNGHIVKYRKLVLGYIWKKGLIYHVELQPHDSKVTIPVSATYNTREEALKAHLHWFGQVATEATNKKK